MYDNKLRAGAGGGGGVQDLLTFFGYHYLIGERWIHHALHALSSLLSFNIVRMTMVIRTIQNGVNPCTCINACTHTEVYTWEPGVNLIAPSLHVLDSISL